jgi:sugar/nucleoside kinase (ribokinase family)
LKKILILGGASWNLLIRVNDFNYPNTTTVFSEDAWYTVGGTGAGKALNLCRLGFNTSFHCMLGNDFAGNRIKDYFAHHPVALFSDLDSQGTEQHTNLMHPTGKRTSIYTFYSTFEPEVDIKRLEPLILDADIIVLNIVNYCRNLIPVIKQNHKPVWCDIHDYNGHDDYHKDFIQAADFITFSSESMGDYQRFMAHLIENGKPIVACTHGSRGSTCLSKETGFIDYGIDNRFQLLDSNGAGDSFFAGLLFGIENGFSLAKSQQIATHTSGLCITSSELYHDDIKAIPNIYIPSKNQL